MAAINRHQLPVLGHPLPPHSDMIKDAIRALNDPNGSTKQAIFDQIRQAYQNYRFSNSGVMAASLEALKSSGEIVQIEHLFKLSEGLMLQPPPPPLAAYASGNSAKRKQGRPRKLKPTTKLNSEKNVHLLNQVDDVPVEPVVLKEKQAGRPQQVSFHAEETEVFDGPVNTQAVVGAKTNDGLLKKKAGSRVLRPASPQWMVDYAHVREKLDYVQSKMRNAIEVIKPCLTDQQIMVDGPVSTALQDLNRLSSMDIMAVLLNASGKEIETSAEA